MCTKDLARTTLFNFDLIEREQRKRTDEDERKNISVEVPRPKRKKMNPGLQSKSFGAQGLCKTQIRLLLPLPLPLPLFLLSPPLGPSNLSLPVQTAPILINYHKFFINYSIYASQELI